MLAVAEIIDQILGPYCLGCCVLENESVLAKGHSAVEYRLCITPHVVDDDASRSRGPGNQRIIARVGGPQHILRSAVKRVCDRAAAAAVSTDQSVVTALGGEPHHERISDESICSRPFANVVSAGQGVVAALGGVPHDV